MFFNQPFLQLNSGPGLPNSQSGPLSGSNQNWQSTVSIHITAPNTGRPQAHYTPNQGISKPWILRFAQFGLCLWVCRHVFDRKLLEYLP
jgi:hypothetical protein